MSEIPSYFLADNKHDHRKESDKHEKRMAKRLGGKTQRGSGAVRHRRGDVKTVEMLVECKRTDREGISIKRSWVEKITMEATNTGKIPAIALEFGDNKPGVHRSGPRFPIDKDWMAVPTSFFNELLETYRGTR